MCGRFAQYEARSDYLAALNSPLACRASEDTLPNGRYNISPGSQALVVNQRDAELHLEAVTWGYHPPWARKHHQPAMVSARAETAPYSRLFKPLWHCGRALILADGWYEWSTDHRHVEHKQPYYIYHAARRPLFFAALGRFNPTSSDTQEDSGVVLLTGPGGVWAGRLTQARGNGLILRLISMPPRPWRKPPRCRRRPLPGIRFPQLSAIFTMTARG
ncbi:Putative SOS response-associated peptidase YedK [Sodalis glossinidius str. 'morsitans']|uniref:Abasic site processing protein n=1 Tax=Sodalis glossinidius (strain morsitans) TaxID=343509 RepID=Q2NSM4_SODGM|nr:SOS response-associated peptidase family protein [Sodalis glossinidius]BAE74851.1 conserved hypothetical protein [Sodalis glossinidius str. 'morsitans']CRL45688.1 Putative SOS response-associated peptidase YedK [Sodalis glossinidius str. 'morsitans']